MSKTNGLPPPLLRPGAAAALLGLTTRQLRKLAEEEKIQHYRFPYGWRYCVAGVKEYRQAMRAAKRKK